MEITTTLATRYWLKTIIMAVVCIGLGLWGLYDYFIDIPQREEASAKSIVLRSVNAALATEVGSTQRSEAEGEVNMALEFAAKVPVRETGGGLVDLGNAAGWIEALEVFQAALSKGRLDLQQQALVLIEDGLDQYGSVTPPSKYDRPMQWAFILCLPFGFYYLLAFKKMSNHAKIYCLDSDGRLTTPEGSWASDEIVDIDLSRWIAPKGNARSTWTAKVVTSDGEHLILDDYVFEDMHLIIGSLAHKFYPNEWTPLAKRVRVETGEDENPTEDN
ncbi:hypothetical protein H8D29_04745 [PVC group bacterium]|nr:hypothetical protein [PVC group bacterium]